MAATALFDYRARDATGREHRGVAAGASSAAVARELAGRGWVAVDIKRNASSAGKSAPRGAEAAAAPAAPRAAAADDDTAASPALQFRLPKLGGPSNKRLQMSFGMVLRELAALLRAGVPLMRALHLSGDSAADLPVREAMQRISRDLDNGHNLVKAAEHEHRKSGLVTP